MPLVKSSKVEHFSPHHLGSLFWGNFLLLNSDNLRIGPKSFYLLPHCGFKKYNILLIMMTLSTISAANVGSLLIISKSEAIKLLYLFCNLKSDSSINYYNLNQTHLCCLTHNQ